MSIREIRGQMKTAKLGDYLLWQGKLAKVIGEIDRPSIIIELIEVETCPHCGIKNSQFTVITSSPLFQENAEPIKTIKDG